MGTEYVALWEEGGTNEMDDRLIGQLLRRCDLRSSFAFLRLIAGRQSTAPLLLILDNGQTALVKVIRHSDHKEGMTFQTV